jgi:NIPSNAP
MNRRSFTQSMGSAAALSTLANSPGQAQSPARKTRLYRLEYLYLRQGSQGNRVDEFLSSQIPLLARNTQALGVFTAVLGPHVPATVVLSGFASMQEMEAAGERLRRNPEYQAALEKMEKGVEPPYDRADRVLLRATDFSPEIAPLPGRPKTPRVFELRIYHSPTERHLHGLHARFAGPEIAIFQRSGIHPVLYADTIIGPNMPNMTYLTPFASLADREKALDAFAADPEWVKARNESIARGGQIVAQSDITLLRPAPFSPMQ